MFFFLFWKLKKKREREEELAKEDEARKERFMKRKSPSLQSDSQP